MSRWENNARGRLAQAALELYSERGFEQTTVVDIAARAGLTERTFFRHFADKREVLFGGSRELQESMTQRVADAPAGLSAMDAVTSALETTEIFVPERREYSRQRQRIIAANPELQERELMKLGSLAAALAKALHTRGVPVTVASLAANAGIAVFTVAFERWLEDAQQRDFKPLFAAALEELRAVLR